MPGDATLVGSPQTLCDKSSLFKPPFLPFFENRRAEVAGTAGVNTGATGLEPANDTPEIEIRL
jgi:hypothetical protein